MLATLIAPFLLVADLDFYTYAPYDSSVPRPEKVLDYEIGSRITTFRDQERVLQAIAQKANTRVRAFDYGKSVEGRPLRVFAVSSKENISRLESIRKDVAEIAKGNATPELLARTPAVVWINECIHGNEPASFESAMPLLYTLAASQNGTINTMLKDTVVLVNPVFNPDGHERFAVWYNSVAVGSPEGDAYEQREPGVIAGRLNHYRFDMNRDHVALSQPETYQEVAELLRWNPQVYVDQHGQVDTYFFPPNPMSINENVDRDRINHWTDVFGKATASAFDQQGYLYYVRDWFDFFYPGYTDTYSTLTGAIGMTQETDGGKQLARYRNDGSLLTLRHGVDKHFTAALAVIGSAAKNHEALVKSYAAYKKSWTTGKAAGKFQRVVIEGDRRAIARLQAQLTRAGVESKQVTGSFELSGGHDYWSDKVTAHKFAPGSLVVDMAQPNGAIAKALLEPDAQFEPEFIKAQRAKKDTAPKDEEFPGPDGTEFYDTTAWSLPYAHGLKAWWFESATALPPTSLREDAILAGPGKIGFALRYSDQADVLAVMHALQDGLRVSVNTQSVGDPKNPYGPGTFFFLRERNEEEFDTQIKNLVKKHGVRLEPVETAYPTTGRYGPGSEMMRTLEAPKIGVVFGRDGDLGNVGAIWHLMDKEFGLPFTPLTSRSLNGDLRDYTAIVVPSGVDASMNPKLQEWVRNGGHLVLLENWEWANGDNGFLKLEASKEESQNMPGSLFRAQMDPRSALSFGYPRPESGPIELAVPVAGNSFFKRSVKGGSVVRFAPEADAKKLLSGWTYGEETEKALVDTVWLQVQPVGGGYVTVFTQDPTMRAMWPGLHKLFLNSILCGG